MSNNAKTYDDEFRRSSVELLRSSGCPLTHVARELGVSPNTLRRWRDAALGAGGGNGSRAEGEDPGPGASPKELWDENQRLRRQIIHLERQREILKKAASILAEDPRPGMR